MQDILDAATPHLIEIAGLILTALIGWAATQASRKWGLDIEQRHRDALHTALLTGARLALSKQLTAATAIDLILSHVKQSVPDALGKLAPPRDVLENLARAKLEQVAAEAIKAGAR